MGSSRGCSPALAQFNVSSLSVETKPLHEDLCPMRLSAPQPLLRKSEGLSWLGVGTSLLYPFVFLTFEGVRTEHCMPSPAAFPGCLCFLSQRREDALGSREDCSAMCLMCPSKSPLPHSCCKGV